MFIFTQMILVNPYILNAILVVRHCGHLEKKIIVPTLKEITNLIGWIPIIGLLSEVETK